MHTPSLAATRPAPPGWPQGSASPDPDVMGMVVRLLGDAEAALASDRQSARACLARAMALLQEKGPLTASTAPACRPHGGLAGWQIKRLTAYVDEHLGSTIRASDLASVTRLSPSHFAHAFKQAFGETPLAHVTRRRLERACELMLNGNEPLAQIALTCGFCDQSHLTRAFHRAMGVSPQHWRRIHASGPA